MPPPQSPFLFTRRTSANASWRSMGTSANRGIMGEFRARDWERGSDFHDLGIFFPSYFGKRKESTIYKAGHCPLPRLVEVNKHRKSSCGTQNVYEQLSGFWVSVVTPYPTQMIHFVSLWSHNQPHCNLRRISNIRIPEYVKTIDVSTVILLS